ncbi:helix-turn-helix domain-containing protein [Acidovorax kalamii]|uniref:helix-turn-helix domain-containing protein n=1 Tax=Acidovorax kalamii TaxID=2004485 RepID=UPI002090E256|nr:helix-turn-helix domain-containing protein [Acidovorax kalamii]
MLLCELCGTFVPHCKEFLGIFVPSISDRLTEGRKALGLSQQALADHVGISARSQRNYESGERSPDADYLAALVGLGMDVVYILTGQHTNGADSGQALTAEEETLLTYFRDASKEVRRAALGALLGASTPMANQARGSGQNLVGDNAIQIGSVSGKARIKNR